MIIVNDNVNNLNKSTLKNHTSIKINREKYKGK